MVIWRTVPVRIRIKQIHIEKIGGRVYHSFCNDYGDVPVVRFNGITNRAEPVINNRGLAYAARNRSSYRSSREVLRDKDFRNGEWRGSAFRNDHA